MVTPTKDPSVAEACRKVMLNPFSDAITGAVVPDGKMQMSLGLKLQNRDELTMNTTGQLEILLFPGWGNGVAIWGDQRQIVFVPAPIAENRVYTIMQPYTQEGQFIMDEDVSATHYIGARQAVNTAATWRLVSQGLKLSLTNNSDQNDGWWESIRLPIDNDPNQWSFSQTTEDRSTGVHELTNAVITANQAEWFGKLSLLNLVDNNSYETGRIRDLDQHAFMLKCINNDREPVDVKDNYNFANDEFDLIISDVLSTFSKGQKYVITGAGTSSQTPGSEFGLNTASAQEFINGNLDRSFDCIYIRIHGRPANADPNGPQTPTRILSHVVANHEIVYNNNQLLHRIMRPAPYHQGVMNYVAAAMNNVTKSALPLLKDNNVSGIRKRKRKSPVKRRTTKYTKKTYKRRTVTKRKKYTYKRKRRTTKKRMKY